MELMIVMINKIKFKYAMLIFLLLIILILSFFVALSYGSVDISYKLIYKTVIEEFFIPEEFIYGKVEPVHDIIWLLRMPRILLAAIVGAGLSVAGVVIQSIVKNPLADPYILGISSGASLGATLAIFSNIGLILGVNFIGISACIGSLIISILVIAISSIGSSQNSIKLLLIGMALNAICSAFTGLIVYLADDMENIQTITYWLMGSFSGANWESLKVIYLIVINSIIFFYYQSRILDIMLLGDETALTLGYDLKIFKKFYLVIVSLMVGFIVYGCGIIGFVGLLIPHVIRISMGTNHKIIIPISALCGSIFLIWADLGCRVIVSGSELPIGILVSSLGGTFFLYIMIKNSYRFWR